VQNVDPATESKPQKDPSDHPVQKSAGPCNWIPLALSTHNALTLAAWPSLHCRTQLS